MSSDADQTKKEALFNEVKGSLFEYLVARRLAGAAELSFLQTLDQNYLNILSQQDRMVRQFYPEMQPFLIEVSQATASELVNHLKQGPKSVRLRGKFSTVDDDQHEADLVLELKQGLLPVSLKLNKAGAFVNTKSGGIKSFFQLYFPHIEPQVQFSFNHFVDQEFCRMSHELHLLNDLPFDEGFANWRKAGKSELPGELRDDERKILKAFYARIAASMHQILESAFKQDASAFLKGLAPLMGFGSPDILQVVCFHEFKRKIAPQVQIHSHVRLLEHLERVQIKEFKDTASVNLSIGEWALQIRVKPMNTFTTTAIKINCSVKFNS